MSVRLSPGLSSRSEVGLPPEIEGLLVDVVADGFTVHCCGPKTAPRALVASYQWEDYVDLATIRGFDRVTTARVPAPQRARVDVFAPETVVWAYEGPPQRALRALLDLVHPQHPDAPTSAYPAPPALYIPRTEQRPMTIRLPPPGRARTRATRLAAATTTEEGTIRLDPWDIALIQSTASASPPTSSASSSHSARKTVQPSKPQP